MYLISPDKSAHDRRQFRQQLIETIVTVDTVKMGVILHLIYDQCKLFTL